MKSKLPRKLKKEMWKINKSYSNFTHRLEFSIGKGIKINRNTYRLLGKLHSEVKRIIIHMAIKGY